MKKVINKLSAEEFKLLVGSLRYTCRQLCLRKIMQDRVSGEPWQKFPDIWSAIIISLRNYYLINLAKIFDKESYYGDKITLSIFRAIPKSNFSLKNQKTIDNILRMRRELLAHFESKVLSQGNLSERDYDLDDGSLGSKKIEDLIDETFILLSNYGYAGELKREQEKKYVEERFSEWYKAFIDHKPNKHK